MISVYLDTQDYLNLYRCKEGSPNHAIKVELLSLLHSNKVQFFFSFVVLGELLQDYETGFENDRIERAKFLELLCGSNGVPFFGELRDSGNTASTWLPSNVEAAFKLSHLKSKILKEMREYPGASRKDRRRLSSSSGFKEAVRNNPKLLVLSAADLVEFPLPEEFLEKQLFRSYILGEISDLEANRILVDLIAKPTNYFKIWFKYNKSRNPLQDTLNEPVTQLFDVMRRLSDKASSYKSLSEQASTSFTEMKARLRELNKLNRELGLPPVIKPKKQTLPTIDQMFDSMQETMKPLNLFPYFDDIYRAYVKSIIRGQKPIKSDIVDIIHANHIQHVDLWRGDRAFCEILKKADLPNKHRVVSSLIDLPSRIKSLL